MMYSDQAAKLRYIQGYNMDFNNLNSLQMSSNKIVQIKGEESTFTKVIAVTSGKGGVGKTTFSVNLSIMLAQLGKKVLLMDGDLGLANVNVLLGILPERNIYDVFKGKRKISEILIKTQYGIDFIAGANGIDQLANLSEEQRSAFLKDLETLQGYDFLIIDTGAGVGPNVIGFLKPADDIIVVTTPEPTAITNAYGMIKSIVVNREEKRLKLVVNQVNSAIEAKKVSDRLTEISAQFLKADVETLGFIFKEDEVLNSIRHQRPLVVVYTGSKSASCINHISRKLLNLNEEENQSTISGFFGKIFNIFEH